MTFNNIKLLFNDIQVYYGNVLYSYHLIRLKQGVYSLNPKNLDDLVSSSLIMKHLTSRLFSSKVSLLMNKMIIGRRIYASFNKKLIKLTELSFIKSYNTQINYIIRIDSHIKSHFYQIICHKEII